MPVIDLMLLEYNRLVRRVQGDTQGKLYALNLGGFLNNLYQYYTSQCGGQEQVQPVGSQSLFSLKHSESTLLLMSLYALLDTYDLQTEIWGRLEGKESFSRVIQTQILEGHEWLIID